MTSLLNSGPVRADIDDGLELSVVLPCLNES
jgi:hypothetical protein